MPTVYDGGADKNKGFFVREKVSVVRNADSVVRDPPNFIGL